MSNRKECAKNRVPAVCADSRINADGEGKFVPASGFQEFSTSAG
jgi:hypothetical protein